MKYSNISLNDLLKLILIYLSYGFDSQFIRDLKRLKRLTSA
jgi:hypothetical protein